MLKLWGVAMVVKVGDIVTRKSYQHDLIFRVHHINKGNVQLYGIEMRLQADAPMDDLEKITEPDLEIRQQKTKDKEEFSFRLFHQDYQLMREKRHIRLPKAIDIIQLNFSCQQRCFILMVIRFI